MAKRSETQIVFQTVMVVVVLFWTIVAIYSFTGR
jgi:hypothetical protein